MLDDGEKTKKEATGTVTHIAEMILVVSSLRVSPVQLVGIGIA